MVENCISMKYKQNVKSLYFEVASLRHCFKMKNVGLYLQKRWEGSTIVLHSCLNNNILFKAHHIKCDANSVRVYYPVLFFWYFFRVQMRGYFCDFHCREINNQIKYNMIKAQHTHTHRGLTFFLLSHSASKLRIFVKE